MTTATTTPFPTAAYFTTARDLYLGWVDASLDAQQRAARVARVCIDETLGAQQDFATAMKRAVAEAQDTAPQGDEQATPLAFIGRAGDFARTSYAIWTEAGLKAQERFTRVAQTTIEEMRGAQSDLAQRTERRIGAITKNGK